MYVTIGLLAIFYLAGLYQSSMLTTLGILPEDINNISYSMVFIRFLAYIGLLAGVATIVMGLFGASPSDLPITAAFATPLSGLIIGLASMTAAIAPAGEYTFIKLAVWLIFSPLIVGYIIALYDWVRGKD